MALRFYCLLYVTTFWITSLRPVISAEDFPELRLHYKVEDSRENVDAEVLLLDGDALNRIRRYVADSQPLDEYTHNTFDNARQLASLSLSQDKSLPSRQTKDTKFTDDKLPAGVSDNSAAQPPPAEPPSPPPPPPPPTPTVALNKSVIISAAFDSDNNPPQAAANTSSPQPIDDDDLPVGKYTDDMIQSSMSQNNVTKRQEDTHVYYNSSFLVDYKVGHSYWVDMSNRDDVKVNHMLSKSHRRAATVKLSFDFPFYGHSVRNVTIATGGFLYTGEYVHSWLAATQYIAPLMANFDTSISNESFIKYVDNGTAFTVQWERVVLQDKPNEGEFTFQATLHASGDIVFVYQHIPVIIESIQDDQHPVKVGLSDAYIIDRTIFFVRRKTIYEYHRVNFKKEDIKNWTVIYLNALPTCMEHKDCASCVTADIGFECKWCPGVGRCSTGMDRRRQDWLHNECDRREVSSESQCGVREVVHHIPAPSAAASPESGGDNVRVGGSGYLGAAFILVLIAGVAIWTLYAYSNPHSYSGQILIRYRPSQWSWRRGEARYTAATIHM